MFASNREKPTLLGVISTCLHQEYWLQQGWNQVSVDVWTHARDGLTENDFILAAKLNKVPKEDLLKKPKKKMIDTY